MSLGRIEEFEELVFSPEYGSTLLVVRDAAGKAEEVHQHTGFRIKMKNDVVRYVVDLSGKQFGVGNTMMKWYDYEKMMGLQEVEYQPKPGGLSNYSSKPTGWSIGQDRKLAKEDYGRLKNNKSYVSTNGELRRLTQCYVTTRMYIEIDRWIKERKDMTMPKMIPDKYTASLDEMIERVMNSIIGFVNYVKASDGILELDKLVRGSKNKTLQYNDESIKLPSGVTHQLNERQSDLWP